MFEYFSKVFRENSSFIKNRTKTTSTLKPNIYFLIKSQSILLIMRNDSDKSCRGNQNTYFVLSNFFRWVDNIRMDLQEVGCGYMDWIGLAQDRDRWRMLVSAVMNIRVP